MKKRLFCLGLCLAVSLTATACDDDLFQIQGENNKNSAVIDENGYQTYGERIKVDEKPEIIYVSVTAECSGNLYDKCYIGEDYPGNVLISQTVGIIGPPVQISAEETVKNITMTLTYNETELRGIPEKNIFPMYVNYEESTWKIIEDFNTDTEKNTVSFPVENEGVYILFDIYQYGKAMGMEISQYAYEKDKTLYQSDWERERDTGDILKLADKKWAVENAPTYHVSTPEQLAGVVYYVNAINEKPVEIYLENDLDLSEYHWKPMGWTNTHATNLTFHGQNHTINGLTINCRGIQEVGFTGYAWSIIMEDVSFTNVNISGSRCVGGFSGECYGTKKFTNVSLSGEIHGNDEDTGGFIGRGGEGIYTDCKLDVTVNGEPCRYFSYTDKFRTENTDETAFTLSVNSNNRVQRTENDKYDRISWVIYDGDDHLMSRGAENETEIPDSLWEYLKAEKGKTYTVYMEAYKRNSDGTSGYTRVSNILKYIY